MKKESMFNKGNMYIILLLILPFIYFYPYYLKGYMAAGDGVIYYLPNKSFVSEFLKGKSFWNQYVSNGFPYFGDQQVGILYPLNLIIIFIKGFIGFNIFEIIHYSLAGIFMFLFLKEMELHEESSLLGALSFMFCGFLVGHRSHLTMVNAAIWLPLILFFWERYIKRKQLKYAIYASIIVAIQLFAGHIQIFVYSNMLFFMYIFINSCFKKDFKLLLKGITIILIGSLLAMVQILPTYELSINSIREKIDYNFFKGYSFSFKTILLIIFPYIFGASVPNGIYKVGYYGPWNLTELFIYQGIIPIIISMYSIKLIKKYDRIKVWIIICIISFVLLLGGTLPSYKLMFYIPIYNLFRCPARNIYEFNFCISVLFALVINHVINNMELERKTLKKYFMFASLVFTISIIILLCLKSSEFREINIRNFAITVPIGIFVLSIFVLMMFLYARVNINKRICLVFMVLFIDLTLVGRYHEQCIVPVNQFSNIQLDNNYRTYSSYQSQDTNLYNIYPYSNLQSKNRVINNYNPFLLKNYNFYLGMETSGGTIYKDKLLLNNTLLSMMNVKYVLMNKKDYIITSLYNNLNRNNLNSEPIFNKKEEIEMVAHGSDPYILQNEVSLEKNTFYIMKVDVEVTGKSDPNDYLAVDLQQNGYDNAEQELDIPFQESNSSYKTFYKIVNTSECPDKVNFRIFTFSNVPVKVKNVVLSKISYSENNIVNEMYKPIYNNGQDYLCINENALPRVFLVDNVVSTNDANKIFNYIWDNNFKPKETAIVENFKNMKELGKGKLIVKKSDNDEILITASVDNTAYMVLSDTYYPGWKAYIDGKETNIYKTNGMFRGILVPKGNHTITFKYVPKSFYIGAIISLSTFLIMIILLLVHYYNNRRKIKC